MQLDNNVIYFLFSSSFPKCKKITTLKPRERVSFLLEVKWIQTVQKTNLWKNVSPAGQCDKIKIKKNNPLITKDSWGNFAFSFFLFLFFYFSPCARRQNAASVRLITLPQFTIDGSLHTGMTSWVSAGERTLQTDQPSHRSERDWRRWWRRTTRTRIWII